MKKKFTMLFAALLACVGVTAQVTNLEQLSNDAKYVIASDRCYLTYTSANGEVLSTSNGNNAVAFALNNANHQFQIIKDGENYYLYSVGAAKYVDKNGKLSETATDALTLDDVSSTYANYPWKLCIGGNGLNSQNAGQAAAGIMVNSWTTADAGNCYVIYDVASYTAFPVTNNFYVIECPLFESVQGVKKALYVNGEGKAVWGTEDLTNNNHYWIPTVNAETGEVALKNFGTNTYLSKTDGTMTSEIANATLKPLGGNLFNINLTNASEALHANGHGGGASATGTLTNWNGGIGSASAWTFVQKNDPTALAEVTVNYSFTYGGVEKYTQETTTLVGEEWPAITTAFPFGVSATKPAGEVSAEGAVDGKVTKVIELAVNLPFTYAADYASIENWYYIQMHSSPGYGKYLQAGEGFIEWADATVDANDKDSYTWAFIGNPFDGLMLVNASTGETKAVNADPNAKPVVVPALGDIATGTKWAIKASRTNPDAEHFCFQYPENNNYMNGQNGKVAFWTDNDQGSTMWVTLRDDAAVLQALVDATEEKLEAWEQTGVGYVTASAEDKAAISEAVADAKTAIANKTGYDAAEAALNAAVAAAKTYTIQPDAEKFYTIVNAHTDHRGGQSIYVNKDGGMQFAKTGEVVSEIARVFQFVPANDGKFYLGNIENGTYLSTAKGHGGGQNNAFATLTDDAVAVTITNMGKDNQVKIVPDGGAMIHAQNAGSQVVGWDANNVDDASAWKIVETELSLNDLTHSLTVSEAGWATLVLGYNTTIPTGVKAYAVSSITEGKAVLTEVAEALPAHTPVLIEAAAGEYVFNYTTDEATVASNLLAGSVFNTYVAPVEGTTNYVLSNNNGVVALYKKTVCNVDLSNEDDVKDEEGKVVENINDHITFAANKAYLPVKTATEGAPAMFAFSRGGEDEDTTGIDQLINNGEVVIYDLAGRRVEKMEKGIYIVNGKKVVK